MDQLAAECPEKIGYAVRIYRLELRRGCFRIGEVGSPPLLHAFGGDLQAADPVRHFNSAFPRPLQPVGEKVLCWATSYTASEIGVTKTSATGAVKRKAAVPEGPPMTRVANAR